MEKITLSSTSLKGTAMRSLDFLKRVPWILGTHAFLCIIVCFVLAVCLGMFLFYNNVYLAKVGDPDALILPIRFNEQAYQSLIKEWQLRETIFSQPNLQNYSNPFNKN